MSGCAPWDLPGFTTDVVPGQLVLLLRRQLLPHVKHSMVGVENWRMAVHVGTDALLLS